MQIEDWNDLRAFLAIARAGQIASAARMLQVDSTTVSRRLRRLERALGQRLVEQTRSGQILTQAGENLLSRVERMAQEAEALFQSGPQSRGLGGQIRLSVSEAGFWHPGLRTSQERIPSSRSSLSPVADFSARQSAKPILRSCCRDRRPVR